MTTVIVLTLGVSGAVAVERWARPSSKRIAQSAQQQSEPSLVPESPVQNLFPHENPEDLKRAFAAGLFAPAALVGSVAPSFALPDLTGPTEVQLSALVAKKKPVVLVFGSFSCNRFCDQAADVERLYQRYQDRAEFLGVYVKEAGHRISSLEYVLAASTQPDRQAYLFAIRKAAAQLGLSFRWVMDMPQGAAARKYMALPLRLIVVDCDGRIAVDLGVGVGDGKWDLQVLESWLESHAVTAGNDALPAH
jgi:hypothetical protein